MASSCGSTRKSTKQAEDASSCNPYYGQYSQVPFPYFLRILFGAAKKKRGRATMPLIIMSGRPSTGKTTRAQELEKYFKETCQKTTHLINEETLLIDKKEGYQGIHFTILLLNLPPLVPF